MRFLIAALAVLLPQHAHSQECPNPELLRGKAQSFKELAPAPQPPKGEFETSKDYASRTAIVPLPETILLRLEPSAGEFNYDADNQRFNWTRTKSWADVGMWVNYISAYSPLYTILKGEAANFMSPLRVRSLTVELKETSSSAVLSRYDIQAVLFERPGFLSESWPTSTVAIKEAPQIKKGLRAVALIAPRTPPYFYSETGVSMAGRETFRYSLLLGNIRCLGFLDGSGNLVGSHALNAD